MDDKDVIIEPCVLPDDPTMVDLSGISYTTSPYTYGTITINTSASGYNGTWGSTLNSNGWSSIGAIGATGAQGSSGGLHVSSNAVIEGNLTVKGVNITEVLESINKRLAILVPDPEKLAHFEALKKAYDHYKTLEALCEIPKETKE